MQRPTDRNGFTLVELAVSLVVIGLLIGLGTAMVGPLMSSIKVRESRENLGAAVE
ncbi:MAG: type II secretion system protein, partial [Geobacter sp.]